MKDGSGGSELTSGMNRRHLCRSKNNVADCDAVDGCGAVKKKSLAGAWKVGC
jgi:hypothetical protein